MAQQKCWRYETMFPADLREAVQTFPVAWLGLSPLEWHGEALALGCDPAITEALCGKAWERTGGVLLPTLYLGTGTNYPTFGEGGLIDQWEMELITGERNPGSIFVRPVTLELALRDYLFFLGREGFKLCVVVSGHGAIEQVQVIDGVCQMFQDALRRGNGSLYPHYWKGGHDLPEELQFPGAGGHADFNEASLLGGVDSALVRKERFGVNPRDRKTGLDAGNAGKIDFEKGARVIDFQAERLSREVGELVTKLYL